MPQLGIEVTEEERTRIKLACIAQGETITDVGKRLLLEYAERVEQERRKVGEPSP